MKLFFAYLKTKRRTLLCCAVCACLLIGSFLLYRLPAAAVLYPMLLCLLCGAVFLAVDFGRVTRKLRQLSRLSAMQAESIRELPRADSLTEEAYADLARALCRQVTDLRAADAAHIRDVVDYYTVWAHQIKTPIASMQLTLQGEDSPAARSLSSDLMRISQYVDMVLAYLRLDSDQTDYVIRPCVLDEVLRPSLRKFAPEFIGRHLSLTYDPPGVTAVTDEKWLSFVIEQLISNALKYTREGGVTIRMRDAHTLAVSDTGIGIAPEDLPRVFDKGYTGCNGRTDRAATGLGLYLCRRICRNLGVGIRIESEPGQGTTVLLDLEELTEDAR